MPSILALVRQSDYDLKKVYRVVSEAVELLGGMRRFVSPGERILLKPNLLSPSPPEKAITTHPAVVEAAIALVREAGGTPLLGDSPGAFSLARTLDKTGLRQVAERWGVEILDFDQERGVEVQAEGVFRRIEMARAVQEVDGIINLPKLKTHGQMTLTLAVKNLFGCIPGRKKAQWHLQAGVDRDLFAELLLEIYLLLRPRLHLLDGILAMEGDGPGAGGSPRWLGLIAASEDGLALDLQVTRMLGIPVSSVPVLRVASRRGLQPIHSGEVLLRGEAPESYGIANFRPPRSIDLTWGLPAWLRRLLREALLARPLVDRASCNLCRLCCQSCPVGCIKEKQGGLVIDRERCILCFCCQEVCPRGAIGIRQGWASKLLGRHWG